ncbi:neuroligin-4, X-linked [Hetaerina americana]|uniref:neuroligin-4, X-linked n=1 Tax=Hetaerina americana TaxID=62018 RepID=UPI003A7F3197
MVTGGLQRTCSLVTVGGTRAGPKYPVIVFIHGESYEWNSGNPYDGSLLAAYGRVVVVTLNFRLGILGFLRPGVGEHTVSNFGLLDQIAALQWVKENIGSLGGDVSSVTLMGHGTGAACVNLLLVSPVSHGADGLFHRAILMSGTALGDWALTASPLKSTIQVAEALNCPLRERDDELAACLRRKRLAELMRVRVGGSSSRYDPPFGPVVDGSVVPNEPMKLMGVYRDLFSRYDLLLGTTQREAHHSLSAAALAHGLLQRERDDKIKKYVRARYEIAPDQVFAAILKHYDPGFGSVMDSGLAASDATRAEQHRDILLQLLGDARSVAPMVQTADFHSAVNPKSYFYVFSHRTKFGDYPGTPGSVPGEELPYVFGAPLDTWGEIQTHFPQKYNAQETLFAEAVMTFWTNFAKTGNPNAPRRQTFSTQGKREWLQYQIDWPEYDTVNQTYLLLGIPPSIGRHYRRRATDFWNREIPQLISDPNFIRVDTEPMYPGGKPKPFPKPSNNDDGPIWDPPEFPPSFIPPPRHRPPWILPPDTPDSFPTGPNMYEKHRPGMDEETTIAPEAKETVTAGISDSSTFNLIVIVGACFLAVNLCVFAGLYYQRDKIRRLLAPRRAGGRPDVAGLADEKTVGSAPSAEKQGKGRSTATPLLGALRRLGGGGKGEDGKKKMHRGEEDEEDDAEAEVQRRRRWLARQCSASTMDPHTKVREWIAHDVVQRYSPRFLRRKKTTEGEVIIAPSSLPAVTMEDQINGLEPVLLPNPTPSPQTPMSEDKVSSASTLRKAKKKKASGGSSGSKKISVAVDATSGIIDAPETVTKVSDSTQTLPDDDAVTVALAPEDVVVVVPGKAVASTVRPQPPLSTFAVPDSEAVVAKDINAPWSGVGDIDINVTCRDERADQPLLEGPEATLRNIKKRNYPKVLPDLAPFQTVPSPPSVASSSSVKRRSLPPPSQLAIVPTHAASASTPVTPTTVSVPKADCQTQTPAGRVPPPPPPRVSSTLRRNHSDRTTGRRGSGGGKVEPKVIIKPTISKKTSAERPVRATPVVDLGASSPTPAECPPSGNVGTGKRSVETKVGTGGRGGGTGTAKRQAKKGAQAAGKAA